MIASHRTIVVLILLIFSTVARAYGQPAPAPTTTAAPPPVPAGAYMAISGPYVWKLSIFPTDSDFSGWIDRYKFAKNGKSSDDREAISGKSGVSITIFLPDQNFFGTGLIAGRVTDTGLILRTVQYGRYVDVAFARSSDQAVDSVVKFNEKRFGKIYIQNAQIAFQKDLNDAYNNASNAVSDALKELHNAKVARTTAAKADDAALAPLRAALTEKEAAQKDYDDRNGGFFGFFWRILHPFREAAQRRVLEADQASVASAQMTYNSAHDALQAAESRVTAAEGALQGAQTKLVALAEH